MTATLTTRHLHEVHSLARHLGSILRHQRFDTATLDRLQRIHAWSVSWSRMPDEYKRRYVLTAGSELAALFVPPRSDRYSGAQVRVIRAALALVDTVRGE
jgi:hypothetical protein